MNCGGRHRWERPFGSLMVCIDCGQSRTAPRNIHYDKNGLVREDSDEIHERKEAERTTAREQEREDRLQQLQADLEEIERRTLAKHGDPREKR